MPRLSERHSHYFYETFESGNTAEEIEKDSHCGIGCELILFSKKLDPICGKESTSEVHNFNRRLFSLSL